MNGHPPGATLMRNGANRSWLIGLLLVAVLWPAIAAVADDPFGETAIDVGQPSRPPAQGVPVAPSDGGIDLDAMFASATAITRQMKAAAGAARTALTSAATAAAANSSAPTGLATEVLIIGHMGAPAEVCENTIPSFERALQLGANCIETDLSFTKDGFIVHWHDWNPNDLIAKIRQLGEQKGVKFRPRNPDLFSKWRKPVCELNLADFRREFGYTLRSKGIGTSHRAAVTIPTLAETAAWAAKQSALRALFLDVKIPKDGEKYVKPFFTNALAILRRYGLEDRAVFMIPHANVLEAARAVLATSPVRLVFDQELPAGVIVRPSRFSAAQKAIALRLGLASIGRPVATIAGWKIYRDLVKSDVEAIRRHNLARPPFPIRQYICWTLDDPDEITALLRLGANGIVSNRPERVKAAVEALTATTP